MIDANATIRLDARLPSGECRKIVIRIGTPHQHRDHAVCPIVIERLDIATRQIRGEDTFQALILCITYVRRMLEIADQTRGWRFELDGEPFDWQAAWFSQHTRG